MNTRPEPNDAVLKSLLAETSGLPQKAAAQARARRQAQRNVARAAVLGLVLFAGIGLWFAQRSGRSSNELTSVSQPPPPVVSPAVKEGYVKAYRAGEASEANAIPADASAREKELWAALPGVPVLIVENGAGEVARVHVFER